MARGIMMYVLTENERQTVHNTALPNGGNDLRRPARAARPWSAHRSMTPLRPSRPPQGPACLSTSRSRVLDALAARWHSQNGEAARKAMCVATLCVPRRHFVDALRTAVEDAGRRCCCTVPGPVLAYEGDRGRLAATRRQSESLRELSFGVLKGIRQPATKIIALMAQ